VSGGFRSVVGTVEWQKLEGDSGGADGGDVGRSVEEVLLSFEGNWRLSG